MPTTTTPDVIPSKHDLAVTIGKNTFFGVLSSLIQVSTRFVTVPIVIAYLGLGGYGIWSVIMTTAAYMRFGSAGIKSAFQKYVAEATGKGDFETANKLLSTGCAAMFLLSVAGLIPIAIFSRRLAQWAGVQAPFLKSAAGAISMLALITVFANAGAVYEAIVMGGHRIDVVRKINTLLTVAEAVAIIVALHWGYGLFAMAAIMAASEIAFISSCFVISRRIIPQIKVRTASATKSVLYELVRFGGSYQLVNVLEVLYAAILPIAILRSFGDNAAGAYAIVTRIVASALILHESFLQPILSGGTMVYASGSIEWMRRVFAKSIKVTLALSLLPLAFVGAFGAMMILAWTGQSDPSFSWALRLVSLAMLFKALCRIQEIMYRVSGRALMDSFRQVLGILTLLGVTVFARQLGFYGVLSGLAVSELIGMVLMFFAVKRTFHSIEAKMFVPDVFKIGAATIAIIAIGALAARIPLPNLAYTGERIAAAMRLGVVAVACFLFTWPTLILTKSMSIQEGCTLLQAILPNRLLRNSSFLQL